MQPSILNKLRGRFNQDLQNEKIDQKQDNLQSNIGDIQLSSIAERIRALAAQKREAMKTQDKEKEMVFNQGLEQKETQEHQEIDAVALTMKNFQKNRKNEKKTECVYIDLQEAAENNLQPESNQSTPPTTAPNRKSKQKKTDSEHIERTNSEQQDQPSTAHKGYSHLFKGKFNKAAIENAIQSFQEKQRVLDLEIERLKTEGKTKMSFRIQKNQPQIMSDQRTISSVNQNSYKRQVEQNQNTMKQWLERRRWEVKRKTDLTVLSLDELVEQAHNRGVISSEIRYQYIGTNTQANILEFISLFIDGKFDKWNYKSLKITILDHRRIVQNLISLYPSSYCVGPPIALHSQINAFLVNLYNLSAEDYSKLCKYIDSISGITFWQTQMIKVVKAKKRTIEEVYSTNNSNHEQSSHSIPKQERNSSKNTSNKIYPKKNLMKKSSKHQS